MPVLQDLWLTMTTILVTTLLCMASRTRQTSSRIKQQDRRGYKVGINMTTKLEPYGLLPLEWRCVGAHDSTYTTPSSTLSSHPLTRRLPATTNTSTTPDASSRANQNTSAHHHVHDETQIGLCGNATYMADLIRKGNCRPVEQPMPVPVPSGYESVSPAVVMVTRCQGLTCHPSSYSCVPLYVTDLNIPVYAHAHRRTRTCMEVKVEQHTGCRCACDRTCPVNQVLNKDECACVCDSKEQEMCEVRQRLWDATTCSCVCPPALVSQCSSGEVFIPELCRCELY